MIFWCYINTYDFVFIFNLVYELKCTKIVFYYYFLVCYIIRFKVFNMFYCNEWVLSIAVDEICQSTNWLSVEDVRRNKRTCIDLPLIIKIDKRFNLTLTQKR